MLQNNNILYKDGFSFGFDPGACKKCSGICCCGESGYIWINQREIQIISNFLKINIVDFKNKYLNQIDNRLTIKEKIINDDYVCIFFDYITKKCSIYSVRPLQCKEFPFWNSFKDEYYIEIQQCPGIRIKH